MNLHPSLHKAILAGVARAPLDAAALPAAVAPVLSQAGNEAALWQAIAAVDLWQRAGYLPAVAQQPEAPACAEAPACPQAAEQMLLQMLRGVHAELLENWLVLAKAHGVLLPHVALVPLLDAAVQSPALLPLLQPVLGPRGAWLAAHNPAWQFASAPAGDDSAQWQLGSIAERCAALAALQTEWAQEPPEHRIALLPCLETGLSLADEAFLELALDDKRKEVRTGAQLLLASLPGSKLRERAAARLDALFTLECKSGLGARLGSLIGATAIQQLAVRLPDACDKVMKRDGIGVQSYPGLGEKAGWLLDMMRNIPPQHWSSAWQLSPDEVLDVFAAQEFKEALVTGLAHAAVRTLGAAPDAAAIAWFATLIDTPAQVRSGLNLRAILLPELHRLPMAEQERLVTSWLESAAGRANAHASAFAWAARRLERGAGPLSPALSRLLLTSSQRQMTEPHAIYGANAEFKLLGRTLDISGLDYIDHGWPAEHWAEWPRWRALVDELTDTLNFRHTMQTSFLENDA
jgi:hypothetical protein